MAPWCSSAVGAPQPSVLLSLAAGVTAIASIGEMSCHGPRCVPAQRALFLQEQWAVCQSHTCLLLQSFLLQIDSCASSKHGDEQPDPRGVRTSVELLCTSAFACPCVTAMLRLQAWRSRLRMRFSRRCSSAWRQSVARERLPEPILAAEPGQAAQ